MKTTIILLALALVLLTARPSAAATAMACDPDDECAPQEWNPDDDDRLVEIESEVLDPETGLLWITFRTASGKLVVISFGTYQSSPDPFPEPVVDQGNPAGDAPCVDESGDYGC